METTRGEVNNNDNSNNDNNNGNNNDNDNNKAGTYAAPSEKREIIIKIINIRHA